MEQQLIDILLDKGVLVVMLAIMVLMERRERLEVQKMLFDCMNKRADDPDN